jgi:Carboxypeptidase regulatory-like domain
MKTDDTKARPSIGFYSATLFAQKSHSFLAAVLLCAAAFSWGCSGFVAGTNSTNPPPPNTYSISGTISPSAGGSGATIALSGTSSATATANNSGAYSFTGLANGTYTVTPSHSGYTFSPASQSVTVSSANVTGINFTDTAQNNTYSISGTISPTAGGSGATLTLSGAASATATANSSGAYTFSGLANGTYAITPSLAGYTYSPTSQNATVNGANVTGINFTAAAQANTYSISGSITLSGSALSGAAVALTGPAAANATTNTSGNYTFSGLANGTYTVTPSLSGDTFTPASQSVTVSGANQTGVNFTATVTVTHTVALSWVASTTATVTSYNIYRSTTNGSGYQVIASVPASTVPLAYTDSNVVNGTTYYYVATAVDSSTGLESSFSNQATAAIP